VGAFLPAFVPSVTAMVGFWATLSLNMPDFTRFGRSQREQALGQVVALPTTMTVFAAMGVFITSASAQVFGEAIWDPIDLGARLDSRVLVAIAEMTAVVATLAMNIAANVVSPANDFSNLAPSKISFRTGGLVTGIVATFLMPWKLLENSDRYINGWLLGYSGGLGSIAGVLICDYWLIRRTHLHVDDLYRRDGAYGYGSPLGTNWAAIVATAAGCFVAWVGIFVPALHWLYDAAWFSGTSSSGLVYSAWMWKRRAPVQVATA
jgi:NCS1 family nucleobase:cation symporter-1